MKRYRRFLLDFFDLLSLKKNNKYKIRSTMYLGLNSVGIEFFR